MKTRIYALILCIALMGGLTTPAFADSTAETDAAIAYVVDSRVFIGNDYGELMMEAGLTRAQLAAVLTRLCGMEAEVLAAPDDYSLCCYFVDVPDWAKPYVGFCADRGLMVGYSLFEFGSNDTVTPAMACTVLLRHIGITETDWGYETACEKALSIGIATEDSVSGSIAKRVDMAVMIYRALTGAKPEASPVSTPEPMPNTGEDYSSAASSDIFNDSYTREAYNLLRETLTSGKADAVMVSEETGTAIREIAAKLGCYPGYYISTDAEGNVGCTAKYPEAYEGAASYTENFITALSTLTDEEKMRAIVFYVCDRLTYSASEIPSPRMVLTSDDVQKGNCMAYARSVLFLCQRAGIPCFLVSSEDHQWNRVYVDGTWWHVDASADDAGDDIAVRHLQRILHRDEEVQGTSHIDRQPMVTTFAMELLIPGSTK